MRTHRLAWTQKKPRWVMAAEDDACGKQHA